MNHKAIRSIALCMCLFGLGFGLLYPRLTRAQTGSTTVYLDPAASEIEVGETVSVDIVVEEVSNLRGVDIHLTFDPAVLEVVDDDPGQEGTQISLGPFLSTDIVLQNEVNLSAGHINFTYNQEHPSTPASGSGVVATITFRGSSVDVSDVAFGESILADAEGNPIEHGTQGSTVTVCEGGTSPISTPTFTPTFTPTPTSTATVTPTVTITPTATITPTITSTPAPPTSTPTPTPTPTPGDVCDDVLGIHTVQPYETLYSIGRAYGARPYTIALCNGIINPNLIHPGDELEIPNDAWSPIPPGPVAQRQFGDEPPPSCRCEHTVQWGENLFRISLRYGVSMWAIAEANNIPNLNYIRAGEVLCIP